jgi:ABC-type sugar transport system substrate-binding protein
MKRFLLFLNRRVFVGLCTVVSAAGIVQTPLAAAVKPTIPIIVKDTTSNYWQMVLAGARKAGKDLNINVPELGAQSPSDINGQISILENAVSEKPAAIVIAPTQKVALGKPIDEAAKRVIIIGIDSAADSKAFTSFIPPTTCKAAASPRMVWPMPLKPNTAKPKATWRSLRRLPESVLWTSAPRASRSRSRPNIRG